MHVFVCVSVCVLNSQCMTLDRCDMGWNPFVVVATSKDGFATKVSIGVDREEPFISSGRITFKEHSFENLHPVFKNAKNKIEYISRKTETTQA